MFDKVFFFAVLFLHNSQFAFTIMHLGCVKMTVKDKIKIPKKDLKNIDNKIAISLGIEKL